MKKLSLIIAACVVLATAFPASARVGCNSSKCNSWSDGALFDAYYQWDWGDLWWIFK